MSTSADSSRIAAPPETDGAARAVNPAALSVKQVARMLGIPAQKVREHVEAGAPTGPQGTVNLVHYVAWMNRELARTDGD